MNGIAVREPLASPTASASVPEARFTATLDARAGGDSAWLAELVATCRARRAEGSSVRWIVPPITELVYRLETLFSLAHDEGFEPVLGGPSTDAAAVGRLSPDERLFVWDFITYRLLDEERASLSPDLLARYRSLQTMLGFEASPAAGPLAHVWDAADVCLKGARAVLRWLPVSWRRATVGDRMSSVLVIGAYGGEHIGDAAILGGVLLRMHQRYGVKRAILMTQRPAHTRHLIPMLDLPVEIAVEPYEHDRIRASLAEVDGVVFGGGPLIDLPKQLVRHLYTASLAVGSGKPFVVEGIGAGPFVRRPSEWVARRLVKMAARVSVRTAHDAAQPLVRDLQPTTGHDPAFDYLATRSSHLTRLPDADRDWVDRLLQGTEGRLKIGVNLRPIRHLFTVGAGDHDREAYTRTIEARFEQRFADGLKAFAATQVAPPCFVFYPMNAIQFGMSDLRSAYRIQRLLGGAVDFRVWEADPGIDGVVSLLRRLDIVIAMRFHAAIYALAHTRRVIGIDYRIGRKDKVAALLDDFGLGEQCRRIDDLTSEWLCEWLSRHAMAHG